MVKYPRYEEYNYRVEMEYIALQKLQPFLPPGSARVPRPLAIGKLEDLVVTVETALPARPLRAYLREHPGANVNHLRAMYPLARWFAELHARAARPATDADLQRHVFEPLEAAAAELELWSEEQAGLSRLCAMAEAATRTPLPMVCRHNDPGTTNVMVDKKGNFVGLIDWESGDIGLPATDLIYFLARFGFETRAAGTPDELTGFRELFFRGFSSDRSALPSTLAAEWLQEYCRLVGVSHESLPLLFGLCWIMHARNERNHLAGLSAEGALVHGKPAAVTLTTLDSAKLESAHFRSQLRFFLLNMTRFAPADATLGGQW
jgi:aminoglycoside phosphotransferase (APT) family kinase protein